MGKALFYLHNVRVYTVDKNYSQGHHMHISGCRRHEPDIYTTKGDACVRVFAKLDQFLPVRSHFDTKRPVNFFHIATFPSPTFGPLFAFHCPLFFTKNNNLQCRDVLKRNGDYPR